MISFDCILTADNEYENRIQQNTFEDLCRWNHCTEQIKISNEKQEELMSFAFADAYAWNYTFGAIW